MAQQRHTSVLPGLQLHGRAPQASGGVDAGRPRGSNAPSTRHGDVKGDAHAVPSCACPLAGGPSRVAPSWGMVAGLFVVRSMRQHSRAIFKILRAQPCPPAIKPAVPGSGACVCPSPRSIAFPHGSWPATVLEHKIYKHSRDKRRQSPDGRVSARILPLKFSALILLEESGTSGTSGTSGYQ